MHRRILYTVHASETVLMELGKFINTLSNEQK
jgi:hypothetical protein